jgi:hypothetical protein
MAAARKKAERKKKRFAIAVSVEAIDADEAVRFVRDMLDAGVHWDHPLRVGEIVEGAVLPHARVHVLTHEHRCGSTLLVYTSEAGAHKALATIAREFWDEAREYEEALPTNPPDDDETAVCLYFEALQDIEGYSIVETALDIRLSVEGEPGAPTEPAR